MNRALHAFLFLFAAASYLLSGCAGITAPDPEQILRQPLGKSSVKVGMTKDRVESVWGKPDEIRMVEDKDKWSGRREMWVYRGRASAIPVDVDYLSETKRLYFDGDHLTNIEG